MSDNPPYAHNDGTGVSSVPGGDFKLYVGREDGEEFTASMRDTQLKALRRCINDALGRPEDP